MLIQLMLQLVMVLKTVIGSAIQLNAVDADLTDTDGSEQLSIILKLLLEV